MRRLAVTVMATTMLVAPGCGDGDSDESIPDVEASQIEEALLDSTELPGARQHQIDVACEEAGEVHGRWDCTMDGQSPVSEEEESELRMSFPDDRGVHLELTAWVTHSELFDSTAYAAVQTGGDPLYEGGGAYYNGGCCIED
jgi:hypothetical protein